MTPEEKPGMPKWQRAPEALKRTFEEAVRPLPGAEVRPMFGYPAAFYNGQMFAGVHQDQIILRLAEEDRTAIGGAAFEPMPGRPMREYVVVPEGIRETPAQLADWLERALAYVASLPPKPAKTKRPAKGKQGQP